MTWHTARFQHDSSQPFHGPDDPSSQAGPKATTQAACSERRYTNGPKKIPPKLLPPFEGLKVDGKVGLLQVPRALHQLLRFVGPQKAPRGPFKFPQELELPRLILTLLSNNMEPA